jgi:tetratricopeptide (TPR) repeat protein
VNNFSPLVVLAVAALVLGCERAPRSVATRPPVRQSFEELRTDGAARLAARDWEGALRVYQAALADQPDDLDARYGVAIALSQLDRADEAAHAFTWVVQHGSPDHESVRVARQWLASAARPATAEPPSERAATSDDGRAMGTVRGRTEGLNPTPGPSATLRILLEGDEAGNRDRRYWAKARLNDRYEISDVAPGGYRLRAQLGPVRLWETRVVVERGRPTIVDLTRATAVASIEALRSPSFP